MVSQDQTPPFDPTPPAPPVLAVLVRHASGDRSVFAASLRALAAQDYPALAVVVVDTGDDDPSELVHDILPTATVHRAPGNDGFGAAANVVLADDGHEIRYFLFCHDDAAPEPAATRGLVDAAEAWHAAVVGPKLVRWDDPGRLAQVGEAVTKTGVTVPLVEPGEVDQGQHDIVHEAFTVPGAFTLVRADVFRLVGGFDEAISFLADDLSLCWRARLAGARVVVEPSVRVRHRAGLAERLPAHERQRLLARHRLRVMLTSYAAPDLLRVVPQAALASLVEVVASLVTLRASRARAVVSAWRWNLAQLGSIRRLRRQVQEIRQVDDHAIRHLQAPGLIRPHLRRPFDLGPRRRLLLHADDAPAPGPSQPATTAATTTEQVEDGLGAEVGGSFAVAAGTIEPFALDRDGDLTDFRPDVDPDGGERAADEIGVVPAAEIGGGLAGVDTGRDWRAALSDRVEGLRAGWTSGGVIVLLGLVGVLVMGSRHLVTRGVPVVGELTSFGPPRELVDEWLSGWRRTGLGSDQPAPTALGALGALGTAASGHVDLMRLLLTLGLLPLGIVGAFRLLRPSGSPRAPVAAALAYACVPVPYAALAHGRWAPLAVYAAAPWLLGQLARATGDTPFASPAPAEGGRRAGPPGPVVLALRVGVMAALLGMVLPLAPLLVLFLTATLVLGSLLAFEPRGVPRLVAVGLGGAVVATLLHLPWSFDVARSWWSLWGDSADRGPWPGLEQAGTSVSDLPDPAELLASAGSGAALAWWALVAAAGLVLLVGRQWRLGWGVRGWVLALVGWGAAWGVSRLAAGGATGAALPSPDVLLALAGAGLALGMGSGVAAVEHDVADRSRRLGGRRMLTALAFVALGLATLPLLRGSLDGYWDMPQGDVTRLLGFVDDDTAAGGAAGSRVLWVGDPSLLPTPGWPLDPGAETADPLDGLAYATGEGLPTVADLWPGPVEGPTDRVGQAVQLAVRRQTSRLGGLLAPMAVEYVVVPRQLAPESDSTRPSPASRDLATALDSQLDLQRIDVDSAVLVYRNTVALPPRAAVSAPELAPAGETAPGSDAADAPPGSVAEMLATDLADSAPPGQLRRIGVLGAQPVLGAGGYAWAAGELPGGAVLLQAAASSDRWRLDVDGDEITSQPAFGWASSFPVVRGGEASLSYDTPASRHLLLALQLTLWIVASAMALLPSGRRGRRLAGRRARRMERREARRLARIRRRPAHIASARGADAADAPSPAPVEDPPAEPVPDDAPAVAGEADDARTDHAKVDATHR